MSLRRSLALSLVTGVVLYGCAAEPGREEPVPAVKAGRQAAAQNPEGIRGDLSRLPKLEPVEVKDSLAYLSSARMIDVVKFYRGQMALRGWNETALESDQRSYAKLRFSRAGSSCAVTLNLEKGSPQRVKVALLPEENKVSAR